MEKKRVSIVLDPEIYERLKKIARENGLSLPLYCRLILTQFSNKNNSK